jgi:hypothetical protein
MVGGGQLGSQLVRFLDAERSRTARVPLAAVAARPLDSILRAVNSAMRYEDAVTLQ